MKFLLSQLYSSHRNIICIKSANLFLYFNKSKNLFKVVSQLTFVTLNANTFTESYYTQIMLYYSLETKHGFKIREATSCFMGYYWKLLLNHYQILLLPTELHMQFNMCQFLNLKNKNLHLWLECDLFQVYACTSECKQIQSSQVKTHVKHTSQFHQNMSAGW